MLSPARKATTTIVVLFVQIIIVLLKRAVPCLTAAAMQKDESQPGRFDFTSLHIIVQKYKMRMAD
jgi:hypothetical protein